MDAADQIFSAFREPAAGAAAAKEMRQLVFEERCVKQVLLAGRCTVTLAAARREALATFGLPYLAFRWFHERFPAFPVVLGASKMPYTAGTHIGWTDLFGDGFGRLPWVREYLEFTAAGDYDPRDAAVGLVFNAPAAKQASLMVIHNQQRTAGAHLTDPEARLQRNTRLVRPFGKHDVVLVTESFTDFLETIEPSWGDVA